MWTPQPPETSRYRKAASKKAASVLSSKGMSPKLGLTPFQYWNAWTKKVLSSTTTRELSRFWSSVITKVIIMNIDTDIKSSIIANRVRSEIMPKTVENKNEPYRFHSVALSYYSKKQLRQLAIVIGTLLSMVAHRCDIEERDFPAWYSHVWLTWMWINQATSSSNKEPETGLKETSTLLIRKSNDNVEVDGVQYTYKEAHHLSAKLQTFLHKEELKP